MKVSLHLSAIAAWLALHGCHGLQVTPGSRCATWCLDSTDGNEWSASASTTNTTDMTCADIDYINTPVGQKFKRCVDCLQHSNRVTNDETDLKWFTYNLRFTIDTCLFSTPRPPPKSVGSPCSANKACQKLRAPLTHDNLSTSPNSTWDYCSANDGAFMGSSLQPCIKCLQESEAQTYIGNFLIALQAGCKQEPDNGDKLGLSTSVFQSKAVEIINPSDLDSQPTHHTKLSPAAITGIAIACAFFLFIAVSLLIVHFKRESMYGDYWENDAYYTGGNPHSPRRPNQGGHPVMASFYPYRGDLAYGGSEKIEHSAQGVRWHEMRPIREQEMMQHSCDTLPVHYAYNPNPVSRQRTSSLNRSNPSHRRKRSNTPDSFVMQTYMDAAGHPSQPEATMPQLQPAVVSGPGPEPVGDEPLPKAKAPKLKMPKFRFRSSSAKQPKEIQISAPILGDDSARFFQEHPPQPVILEPTPRGRAREVEFVGVPMRSATSSLYG